jgi:DNA repair protein RadA/Sms
VAAILSSNEDIAVNKDFCFAGEVGLSGEIRPVKPRGSTHSEAEIFSSFLYPNTIKLH